MILEMKEYIEKLGSASMDLAGREAARRQVVESGIMVNDGPVAFSYVPLILTEKDMETLDQVIVGMQEILSKMTRAYVADPAYRKLFGFSKEMEELICLPCDYDCIIPFGRYDLFYDFESGKYGFCEINTDGSGGMSWNDRVTDAVMDNFFDSTYLEDKGIEKYHATKEFVKGIVKAYESSPQAVADPVIAVVDFKEEGVLTDFQGIIDGLQAAGVQARFTDMRDLKFRDGGLYDETDGTLVHGIYRRAVTSVVLERMEECQELIAAVKAEKVVLMGHFRTSMAHSKKVFAAMYRPETWELLTEEEIAYIKDHVPATYVVSEGGLTEDQLAQIRKNPREWVLKPEEGFGSYGVCCGMDVSEDKWNQLLDQVLDRERERRSADHKDPGMDQVSDDHPYIIQQFCERYGIPVLKSDGDQVDSYPLMLGLFQTNGHLAGCYSRAGKAGVIDYSHGCLCIPTAKKVRS